MNVNTIVMANSCNYSTVFLVEVNDGEGNTRISGAWVTTGGAMEYIEMLDADLKRKTLWLV